MMVSNFLRLLLKDIYIKILALVIAIFIYFNAVMERTQTMTLKIPIVITNLVEGQVVSEKNTDKAMLTIQGKGKDFIGLRPDRLMFKIDLANSRLGVKKVKLFPDELGLPATISLKAVDPEYVELTIDRLSKKPVEISIPLKDKVETGYALLNVSPKTNVYLIGPKEDIGFISVLNTESLNLSNFKESKDTKLKVMSPEGENFSVEPNSVEVSVQIEKVTARIFLGIPLEIEGPTSRLISFEPTEAQIAISGPESKLQTLKPRAITAKLNISNLNRGIHQVRAEITLPAGIFLVKCEPAFFQVTIR